MREFLLNDEKVVKKGSANLWNGVQAIGGQLYLTDTGRLIHVPHRLNLKREIVAIQVSDITDITIVWSKAFGIPLVKNGLLVKILNKPDNKYVVNGPNAWLAAINDARQR